MIGIYHTCPLCCNVKLAETKESEEFMLLDIFVICDKCFVEGCEVE